MNETALKPWVIADTSGVIHAAHCDCMAGLGEACSHVGSLLFYLEAASRINSSKTVTQEKAYWLLPSSIDKVIIFFILCFNITMFQSYEDLPVTW